MSAQPSEQDSHDVIRLGGGPAVVDPVHEYHTLKALRDGTPPANLKNLASNELMAKVTRSADYASWTRDFLQAKD